MSEFRAELLGAQQAAARIKLLTGFATGDNLGLAAQAGMLIIQSAARENAPVKTGTLRRSIQTTYEVISPTEAVATCGPSAPYGKWIEFGTGPHDIYPVNKKALFWEGAEHPVAHVHHPGTAANPFMRPAFDENKRRAAEVVSYSYRAMIRKVMGNGGP